MSRDILRVKDILRIQLREERDERKRVLEYEIQWLLRFLRNKKLEAPTCLEVGCCAGKRSLPFQDLSSIFVGLDINLKPLKEAKTRIPLIVQGEATKLPFNDESFDTVLCFEVIEHIENSLIALNEIHRVLKEGGYAALTTPNRIRLSSILYKQLTRSQEEYPMNPDHVLEYDRIALEELFSKSKFKHYSVNPYGVIRLGRILIVTNPSVLSKYCDHFIILVFK